MPQVGSKGLDMMFRTATIQANYDFSSESDMVKKESFPILATNHNCTLCKLAFCGWKNNKL